MCGPDRLAQHERCLGRVTLIPRLMVFSARRPDTNLLTSSRVDMTKVQQLFNATSLRRDYTISFFRLSKDSITVTNNSLAQHITAVFKVLVLDFFVVQFNTHTHTCLICCETGVCTDCRDLTGQSSGQWLLLTTYK